MRSPRKTFYILHNVNHNYDVYCETLEIAERQKFVEMQSYAGSHGWDSEDDWEIKAVSMIVASE